MTNQQTLKIGTRGSKLAMFQANLVADRLRAAHSDLHVEVIEIKTSGDWKPEHGETRLSEAQGGKGLFAKEIEHAILSGHVDCGVHSMKDMPSFLPDGLVIDHVLDREDPRDALLANNAKSLDDLPQGAKLGTSSTRRAAFLLSRRPDLQIMPLRGNVPTRIQKLRDGQVDATILAYAGLKRLELDHEIAAVLSPDDMLPAAGQGIIGIEIRDDDDQTRKLFDAIHHFETGLCIAAERAALQILDGSCQTPIGAYAVYDGTTLKMRVAVSALDGSAIEYESGEQDLTGDTMDSESIKDQAADLGVRIATVLKNRVPQEWLSYAS